MSELISFLTAEALKPLLKKLRRIRLSRRDEISAIADVFGDPVELAKYYIEPRCQHQNPADINEEEPISVVRSPVFSTINDFFNREFSAAGGGKNTMFVLSDAGMGKTSLLVMIRLTHLLKFWPQQLLCVLLKLGPGTLEKVSELSDKANTILLLDSLDEDPLSWEDSENRIIDILSATTHFRRVVITCRTQYFPKTAADPFNQPGRVEVGGYVCPMIFLSYFDESQVDQYLSKRFPASIINRLRGRSSYQHLQAKRLLSKVHSLQFRPLLLSHIEDLLASQETKWDDYGVYRALIESWLLREERKLREQGYKIIKEHLLKACTDVAMFMQENRTRTINRDELERLIDASPYTSFLKHLNFGGRSLLNRNSNGDYRFSHYSIQEFLLAHLILSDQNEEKKFNFAMTDQMFRFILDRLNASRKILPLLDKSAKRILIVFKEGKGHHQFSEQNICIYCGMSEAYATNFKQLICEVLIEDMPSFIFSGLKFDEMNLSTLDLSGLVFRDCSFARANLTGVNLSSSDLRDAIFDGANLSGANLTNTLLQGATFRGAILDGVQGNVPLTRNTLTTRTLETNGR